MVARGLKALPPVKRKFARARTEPACPRRTACMVSTRDGRLFVPDNYIATKRQLATRALPDN
jgi:hypothetical protein